MSPIKGLTQMLALVCIWGTALGQSCPPPDSIKPCKCFTGDDSSVVCSGDQDVDLKTVFQTIGGNQSVTFSKFILSNSAVKELEDNVFGTVSFKTIELTGTYALTRISRWALNGSAHTLEEFRQTGDNRLTNAHAQELFDALSAMVAINRIFLNLIQVTAVPDNAFRIINGRQTNLESIHLNYNGAKYGSLETVGNRAFYYLDNLKYISIANQPIKHLKAHSFDFERGSDQTLEIHLEATWIHGNSFEEGVFLDSKRPLDIDMSNNDMDYVDEKVFAPVFALPKRVVVIIQNNKLKCDCRMKWLAKDNQKYRQHLLEADCLDGDDIFDKTMDNFANCA